jgi:hypothetical protein
MPASDDRKNRPDRTVGGEETTLKDLSVDDVREPDAEQVRGGGKASMSDIPVIKIGDKSTA